MKKLLLILALATITTTAMAGHLSGNNGEAEITVKAKIISGGLKITDITGSPLVLNLGRANAGEATPLSSSVKYKITSKGSASTDETINIKLAAPEVKIYKEGTNQSTPSNENGTLTVALTLDSETKPLTTGTTEVIGEIYGSTTTNIATEVGNYEGKTLLTATVQ